MEKITENLNNLAVNENGLSENRAVAGAADPTEREPQPGPSKQAEKPQENDPQSAHNDCNCSASCSELISKLSECVICLHPLQNTGVSACSRCGGFWCGVCAKRMACCPFCRAPPPLAPCLALRRLLRDLTLPCRNQRWGCNTKVSTDSRRAHETNCAYGQIRCPMDEDCLSTFPTNRLISHILRVHQLTAVDTNSLNIKIEDFSTKISNSDVTTHKYAMLLVAYGNVFLIKVSLNNFNLNVKIMKKELEYAIPHLRPLPRNDSFCAILGFQCKNMSNRFKVILDDLYYAKKTLVDKNDSLHKSWPGEDVNVFVTITHLSDKSTHCTVTM